MPAEVQAASVAVDSCGVEVERIEIGNASGSVHHKISLERLGIAGRRSMNHEIRWALFDSLDARFEAHVDADAARFLHQPSDEIGIERLEHALTALQDGDLSPRARREVRELGGDVSAADEQDALRQSVELQEFAARDEVLFTGDAQLRRHRARGDENEPRLEHLARHLEGLPTGEWSVAAIDIDALACEAFLHHRGKGLGETALEAHERPPVDRRLAAAHALAAHAPRVIDRLGSAEQHLLWIATAQGAGAAQRKMVDERHAPAGAAAMLGGNRGRRSTADDYEVVAPRQRPCNLRRSSSVVPG